MDSNTSSTSSGSQTPIHTIVKAQIVFLLSTLTEDNFDRNQHEIRSLSEQHGLDTYLHFIRRLIVHSQARLASTAAPSAFDTSTSLTFRLLVQETQRLSRDPFLAERFRDGIDKGDGDIFRHFDLVRFADRVGLRPLERFILASAIVSAPVRKELANQAATIIRVDFENAVLSLCQHPSFDHADLSPGQVGKLLSNLLSDPPADSPILDGQQRQALVVAAQAKYGTDIMAPILQQIFPTLSLPPGTSLVQTLCDLGPEITSEPATVRSLLQRFGITESSPPTDPQVVEIISTLSRFAAEGTQLCDAGALIRALSGFNVSIHWPGLILAFDWPDRSGVDTATLKLLIAILLNAPREVEPHAVAGFWSTWSNPLYQLRLLDALLSLPADTFNFVSLPGHRIVTVDDVANASPTIKALAANVQGHTWNSLELFDVLVTLGDAESLEIRSCVREMLDKAVKISAELVHMGLLQVSKPWNGTQKEYAAKLLGMFLAGHPNHQLVFMRIWQIDPTYLTHSFRDYYNESPLNITRILDVAQDLKILDALLDVRPFTFALDVAALASRREYLNLDKWLADNISNHGADFLRSVINFLELKASSEKTARISDPPEDSTTMALNPQTIAIFLRILRNSSSMLDEADTAYCLEVRNACLQIHPRLMNLSPDSDQEPGFSVVTYSTEVESEVDGIYKQMYDENITIDQVIQMLQRTKESTSSRDHEIFSCMLHFLFDEYKFFQSFYPPRELAMTGYLFGSLIQHRLVDYIPLGIAIRYILDALQCPPDTNLFKFGVQALSRFESRLPEWQPLCEKLLQIPHLLEARPDLADSARRALLNPEETLVEGALGAMNGATEPAHYAFTALKPDDFANTEAEEPEEEVSDKILFLVNNLAPSNFESKTEEMKERFKDQYARWFANYLVDQRVSTEPNNHQLYLRFLDGLDRKALFGYVIHETYVKSANLLNSEKTLQSSSERTILKNLGSWLGSLTLARNKPIMYKNLSFKDLLLEGYDSNRLIVAIPFVCKILEACSKSMVFKPPNPWLMAVISLLVELYHFAELKLNLKFEIEVLCKSLELDLDQVEATTVLRNRPIADTLAGPPLPDYVGDIDALPIGGYDPTHIGADSQLISSLTSASPSEVPRGVGAQIEAILLNLSNVVQVSPELAPLHTNHSFKRAVQIAVDRAVREIILPVVERSVTIAGISTRELVNKDFVSEPNEDKLRNAAHLMARKLAGSLALVTCKEPLKSNLATHIRHFLNEHGFTEHMVPEQVIVLLTNENIDLCCVAIEKAAMDRAMADVDEGFSAAFETRRRHREHRFGQPFWDATNHHTNFSANLPDPLRIRSGGLQPQQGRVYEDFTDVRRKVASRPVSRVAYGRGEHISQGSYPPPSPAPDRHGPSGPTFLSHQEGMERFGRLIVDLERVLPQIPAQSLTLLPPNHEFRQFSRQIVLLAGQSISPDDQALSFSQKVVQHLFKTQVPIGREMYVGVLDHLCQSFPKVAKEAIDWLLNAEDERKFNVPVTIALLRGGLIHLWQQDERLSKFIYKDPRPSLLNFAASLIRECLSADPPVASRHQFALSIEALNHSIQLGRVTEEAMRLLEDLQGQRRTVRQADENGSPVASSMESEEVHLKLVNWFQHWTNMYQESASSEKAFLSFIPQFTGQGILAEDTLTTLFFRVCTEASVATYHQRLATGEESRAFQDIDAFSRLVVMLIKYNGDVGTGANADQKKSRYLTKILSIVVLVLVHQHEERGVDFQQKPFFRFFSSLLHDLHSIETNLHTAYLPLLVAICETFNTLKPAHFPGFAFSWISLISHRLFMPKLLLSSNREGWGNFHQALLSLFHFLSPFLRAGELQHATRDIYQGATRVLIVLLHDFPDFLSEYYFSICDAIPPRCIQLRNLVLSAFPAAITLPDPYMRSMRLEAIPEMGPIPPTRFDITSGLKSNDLGSILEALIFNRAPPSFLQSLKDRLRDSKDSALGSYNLSAINAVVVYVGMSSVAQAKARSGSHTFAPTDPGVGILSYLANHLDPEGQYHLLRAMVLHLRYPNAHTHWFSSLMLHLFADTKDERFKEILTRTLLEHVMVHRPHPWGILVTFIELVRNPKYEFWTRDFIRIAPEITLIMENVAKNIQS
ncbi:Not1-domain-containing protein [Gautieria morchelliformis]|nr:Not1-domain-containing protein [Gautieria morchelliformis]